MDDEAVSLAFRARFQTAVAATTGLATLAATATGYTRSSGNFLTEGFRVGMEVVPTGFPETAAGVITAVTPQTMSILNGRTARAAAANRSLVAGVPLTRIWSNRPGSPDPNTPYVEAELISQPGQLIGAPAQGGTREDRGLYVIRLYGIADVGEAALRRLARAILDLFTPHTTFPAGGDVVRIRGDVTPFASGIGQRASGHALVTLTIPWRIYRSNVVAAS